MYRLFTFLLFISNTLCCTKLEELEKARKAALIKKFGRRHNTRSRIILGNPGQRSILLIKNKRHRQAFYPNTKIYVPR